MEGTFKCSARLQPRALSNTMEKEDVKGSG